MNINPAAIFALGLLSFSIVSLFAQDTQVSDSRGAQHSSPNSSSSPYSSSVSSSSRGVFGSSAMNDRTSALKAAFQVKNLKFELLGPVIRRSNSANLGLNFNAGFFFLYPFPSIRASNCRLNDLNLIFFLSFLI